MVPLKCVIIKVAIFILVTAYTSGALLLIVSTNLAVVSYLKTMTRIDGHAQPLTSCADLIKFLGLGHFQLRETRTNGHYYLKSMALW